MDKLPYATATHPGFVLCTDKVSVSADPVFVELLLDALDFLPFAH
jgi:hypothetical protein